MAEKLSLEQETAQYYQWLMWMAHLEFEKELLEIVSRKLFWILISYSVSLIFLLILTNLIFRVLRGYFFTLDEAAQIISCCEKQLLANKMITDRFTAADIQGGVLKEHLIPEDYLAPQKVNFTIAVANT